MPNSYKNNHNAISDILVVIAAFTILATFGGTSSAFGVFFKPVMNEFGWTRAFTSGAVALSFITHGIVSLALGRLTDRFGPRVVLTINGLFMGLGYILLSQINAAWQLYLFYSLLVGIGNAVHVPLLSTIVRRFKARRGLTSGIVLGGIGAGQLIVPPVAAYLISSYGWQLSFAILGVAALVVIVVSARFLNVPQGKAEIPALRSDNRYTRSVEPASNAFSLRNVVLSREFWMIVGTNLFMAFCVQSMVVHIVPYATDLGIAPIVAASILSLMGVTMMVGRIVIGGAADRIREEKTLIACYCILVPILVGLLFTGAEWYLYLFAILFGLSTSVMVLGSTLVARIWGLGAHARIFSVVNIFIAFAAAAGPYVFGFIHDITGSYRYAFLTDTTLACIGLLFSFILLRDLAKSHKRSI